MSLMYIIIQEYADALNELTPEQAEEHRRSVEKALAAARELEVVKQKLDEQRLENEEKLKQENEGLYLRWSRRGDVVLICVWNCLGSVYWLCQLQSTYSSLRRKRPSNERLPFWGKSLVPITVLSELREHRRVCVDLCDKRKFMII